MKRTLARKILEEHIVSGRWELGTDIGIKIDQTLTQDATGTMAYLEFESLGVNRVRTEISVSYVDHNLLQTDFKNADDHLFLKTMAERYGLYFSPPGNGVSHQVHLERFGIPGKTLLGADSHTSTAGGLGMIAIGAGGLDVALSMAGEPFYLKVPKVFGVRLTGNLPPWVSAKDVILEMLRRHSGRGGIEKIIEYFGPGVANLTVTDWATIANLGAELGATTTIFPSDEKTREFLKRQGREEIWKPLVPDPAAEYDELDEIDLFQLEPLIACPTSPDNIKMVSQVKGIPVSQVIVGSSVNSSFRDLMVVCKVLEKRFSHPSVSLEINPGSRQVLENVGKAGGIMSIIHAGARIHQSGCLGCIGMGQAPATGTVSLRTFPRNFPGRSGTENDLVYLCSPETAAAAAVFGKITDPRSLGEYPEVVEPDKYIFNDQLLIKPLPLEESKKVDVIRGPNIKPFPELDLLPDEYEGVILLKVGHNISTDEIMPAGNKVLPLRSNISAISEFLFERIEKGFSKRVKEEGGGIIVGGENYGQGSSREHAALAPRYLGIRVKIAMSFARIHRSNLINFGIIPLTFTDHKDYDTIKQGDIIRFSGLKEALSQEKDKIHAIINGREIELTLMASQRERECLLEGSLLNMVKKKMGKEV